VDGEKKKLVGSMGHGAESMGKW